MDTIVLLMGIVRCGNFFLTDSIEISKIGERNKSYFVR